MKLEFDTVTAPSHWATYLINGDVSTFAYSENEADEQACYELEKAMGHCVGAVNVGFTHFPDYGLPGDCCEYTFERPDSSSTN